MRLENLGKENVPIYEISVLIMGAIFHITSMKKEKPICVKDFGNCFKNVEGELDESLICGHAGSDFKKVEGIIMDCNSDMKYNQIWKFALELQELFARHQIFKRLEVEIDLFNSNYNNRVTEGSNLFECEKIRISRAMNYSFLNEVKEKIAKLNF